MTNSERIEFLRKWIDALRSGKYKQGRYFLCNVDDEYCCLGVAAEVLGAKKQRAGRNTAYTFKTDDASSTQIISHLFPDVISEPLEKELAHKNDADGYTFVQIADYIEAEILSPLL